MQEYRRRSRPPSIFLPKMHCLYEGFTPETARRLSERFEWHYTPEHGSWLNITECALSILSRQCLSRRIADMDTLRSEVAAWQAGRHQWPHTVTWQLRTEDVWIKLKRLYPIQNDKISLN